MKKRHLPKAATGRAVSSGRLALLVLLVVPILFPGAAGAVGGQTSALLRSAVDPAACKLLDDPELRPSMDQVLVKLLIACDREFELGAVRQEVALDVTSGAAALGDDVLVNDPAKDLGGSQVQSETSIARNEVTGTLCSGYNDSYHYHAEGLGFTGFSRSVDGGQTFGDRGALGANSLGDPSLVWRRSDGRFYFAAIEVNGLGIWRSTDDCQTFQFLGNTHASSGDDKEILTVDNNPLSPFYGRLYVVWTDFAAGARIYANHSSDGGFTWSAAVPLTSTGGVQGAWPTVAPNGDLYVAWERWDSFLNGPIYIEGVRSTNGGASFTQLAAPMTARPLPKDLTATSACARPALNGNVRYLASPQLIAGEDGTLHVVYSYDPDGVGTGDTVDVFYRRSIDHGASWQPEVALDDSGTLNDQFFPTVSTGSSGNVVIATWYDRRLDPNNFLIDYYQRTSFDGGLTWQPSIRVSDVSSPVFLDPGTATCYHGDYDRQIQAGTDSLVQWADDRNIHAGHNDPDVFFDGSAVVSDYLLSASPTRQSVQAPADAVYTVDVVQIDPGFTEPVLLSANGVPVGASASFQPNPVTPGSSSQMTVTDTAAASPGTSVIEITGTSSPSGVGRETAVTLTISACPDCCEPPATGDWVVSTSCTLAVSSAAPANVIVQAPATLTILDGVTLDIDFASHHLLVQDGGAVLVKHGGKID